uniref:Agenet-like domain-containing protein n=1 Tax=Sciurus vulgaris TaxID=55149 RepID=A0A8D2CYW0_SCIVU
VTELIMEFHGSSRTFYKVSIKDVHEDSLTVVFENNWPTQEQMTMNHINGVWLMLG